jgi:DegV family protein with EDD domain
VAVKVITDSTSYVPRELRRELDVGVAGLSSLLDGVTYNDDAEDYEPFYTALEASSAMPTTSQPAVQDMVDLMEERVAAGHEVVGVFISEKMSGTYSTATLARGMVLERHPDAVIEVVDSEGNCMELGFAALAAARAAAAGEAVDAVVAAALRMVERTRLLFVPETLEFLRRGGRIGGASALVGSLLQIKPILTVVNGQTDVFSKVRTKQKAVGTIVGTLATDMREKGGLGGVIVHHIHDEAAGRDLAARVADVVGHPVDIHPIGPAIGAHVGPGAVAVVYHTVDPMRKSG